ncbi:MAG TPA: amidohydrolase family protein [Chloroflexota bacterium]|nr:amidohydrolase family protein [Chloroflexota bacterium]
MIIDVHGHYTTSPPGLQVYRGAQVTQLNDPRKGKVNISDDEIRDSLENGQLKFQRERGTDLALFSPTAAGMGHHFGGPRISQYWSETCNELIQRVCALYPSNFIGVCMLPQSPGVPPANCIAELERCVAEFGFVGCNLNPDPSGGYWSDPPLTDPWWFPLYEKMVELDVPAMVHVAASCNPNFHHTGAHYLNGDTTAFMQFLSSKLFERFPTLRFVIPHGGGAIPFHWGRYRGIARDQGWRAPEELLRNVFFDTCVYWAPGVELLVKAVGPGNVLFGSEMIGAVRGIDPDSGRYFDDTKPYVDAISWLTDEDRQRIFADNALRVYPRLAARLRQEA